GEWESVAELGNQAIEQSLSPGKSNELLVYIEGFARTGDLDQAQQLSATADNDAKLIPGLCEIWKRVEAASPQPDDLKSIQKVEEELKCVQIQN
ncbi:MAG TPA: hypothetical protein VHO48_11530, partial [Anaerolineaceae bacterium]|nr:hypothetical protein [Anaerolineaceae bacterium]